jgi:hypothetical protein
MSAVFGDAVSFLEDVVSRSATHVGHLVFEGGVAALETPSAKKECWRAEAIQYVLDLLEEEAEDRALEAEEKPAPAPSAWTAPPAVEVLPPVVPSQPARPEQRAALVEEIHEARVALGGHEFDALLQPVPVDVVASAEELVRSVRNGTVKQILKEVDTKNRKNQAAIRAWAREKGYPVSTKGRIATDLIRRYELAQRAEVSA